MSDIDKANKWLAEKIGITSGHDMMTGAYYTINNDEYEGVFTIEDPRCREIVRERLKVNTCPGKTALCNGKPNPPIEEYFGSWCLNVVDSDGEVIAFKGKTIAEAEIACILSIVEQEAESNEK